jgi:hypothetical protein
MNIHMNWISRDYSLELIELPCVNKVEFWRFGPV